MKSIASKPPICGCTCYLNRHSLPSGIVSPLRGLALETYRRLPDMVAAKMEMANSKKIQEETWTAAVAATSLP